MSSAERPVLRIVRGDPTPEELAVLTAVVSVAGGESATDAATPRRGGWNDPRQHVRRQLWPGPGAWRGSAR